jgi:hypothetical protein
MLRFHVLTAALGLAGAAPPTACPHVVNLGAFSSLSTLAPWSLERPILLRRDPMLPPISTAYYDWSPAGMRLLADEPVSVGHSGGYIVGGGHVQDQMMISLFLDAIADPDGEHIHARSAVFQESNSSVCEKLFTVSDRAGALHTLVGEVLEGKRGKYQCILSVTGAEAGFGLHQHSASIFLLVHGRKRWWFMPPDATPPPDLLGSVLGNDALQRWNWEHVEGNSGSWGEVNGLTFCDQAPGDIMYIPGQWHHGTSGVGADVVIGFAMQNFGAAAGNKTTGNKTTSQSKSVWAVQSRGDADLGGDQGGNQGGDQGGDQGGGGARPGRPKGKAEMSMDMEAPRDQSDEPPKISEEQLQEISQKKEQVGRQMKEAREDPLDLRGELYMVEHYLTMQNDESDEKALRELRGAMNTIRTVRERNHVAQSFLNELLWKIALKFRDLSELEALLPLLKEIRDKSPIDTRLHTMSGCELSSALFLLKRYDEARQALLDIEPELRRVVGLEPGRSPARRGENIASELGDDEADTAFEISRRLVPELWDSIPVSSASDLQIAYSPSDPSGGPRVASSPSGPSGGYSGGIHPTRPVSGGASHRQEL